MAAKRKGIGIIGRPPTYTPQLIAEFTVRICREVGAGGNLSQICARADMPGRDTVYAWLREHRSFYDDYARARELRADARFDRIDNVIKDMRAGKIDAAQCRVEIDAIKWQAGKEAPMKYGDRLELHADITSGGKTWAEVLREKQAARAAAEQQMPVVHLTIEASSEDALS